MKFEEQKREYEIVPKGMHVGVLYLVADLGTQKYEFEGAVSHKPSVFIGFELSKTQMKEGDNAGKPFVIGQKFKISTFDRAPLPQMIKSWKGIEVKPGFSLKPLLGEAALVNVIHNVKGDNTYANIDTVVPLMDGMDSPLCFNSPIYFDLDDFDGVNHSIFNSLPPFIQKMIQASPEYQSKSGASETNQSSIPPSPPIEAYQD